MLNADKCREISAKNICREEIGHVDYIWDQQLFNM